MAILQDFVHFYNKRSFEEIYKTYLQNETMSK